MANEQAESTQTQETIPRNIQDRIIALCTLGGMNTDQAMILHQVLRNFDNPQIKERMESLGQHGNIPEETRAQFREFLKGV